MASGSSEQNRQPNNTAHPSNDNDNNTRALLENFRLTANVAAHADVATSALRDAYTILAKHGVEALHAPGLTLQMRTIRNTARDIVALVEKDLTSAVANTDAPVHLSQEELDVLFEAFTKATGRGVERGFFEECVRVWNPAMMRRRARLLLRAKTQQAAGRSSEQQSTAKALLEQVQGRRYWAHFAEVIRLRKEIEEEQEHLRELSGKVLRGPASGEASAANRQQVIVFTDIQKGFLYDKFRRDAPASHEVDTFEAFSKSIDTADEAHKRMLLQMLK